MPLALMAVPVMLALVFVTTTDGLDLLRFSILLLVFAGASLAFIQARHEKRARRWLLVPEFLTAIMWLQFGLLPWFSILLGENRTSVDLLVRALVYTMVGMFAFWAGALLVRKPARVMPLTAESPDRGRYRLAVGCAIYLIGFAVKVYLLQRGIFAYTSDLDLRNSAISSLGPLEALAQCATLGLIIIAIEHFSDLRNRTSRTIFWIVFVSECGWGLVSGMKEFILQNFVFVAIIASFKLRKLPVRWIVALPVLLVLLYPITNAYRDVIRGQTSIGVRSVTDANEALGLATQNLRQNNSADEVRQGALKSALSRLDELEDFGTLISTENAAGFLEGDERLWMIPIYPFIPRAIWKSKPILDMGRRASVFLGSTDKSSSAVSPLADGYLKGGFAGLVCGMLVWGVFAERLTNLVLRSSRSRDLFMYSAVFLVSTNREVCLFNFWVAVLQTFVIAFVVTYLVYPRSNSGQHQSMARS